MSRPLPLWTRVACKGCDRCVVLTDAWMAHVGREYFGNSQMREMPAAAYFRLRCTRCGTRGQFNSWPPEQDGGKDRRKLSKAVFKLTNCRRCGGWGCGSCRR